MHALHLVVGYLLHYANSSPRPGFYDMKSRILRRHGTRDGFDIQHIIRTCWGCDGTGVDGGETCLRCNGSGIYESVWVRLSRWRLGPFLFHEPAGRLASGRVGDATRTITGRITHQSYPAWLVVESTLWLALVYDRRLLLSCSIGRCPWAPLSGITLGIVLGRQLWNRLTGDSLPF